MFLKVLGSVLLSAGLASSALGQTKSAVGKAEPAPKQEQTTNLKPAAPVVAADSKTAPVDAKSSGIYANISTAPLFQTASSTTTEAKIDESALRYYAAQKNKKRVDLEIRRLKSLYPSWAVPNDLYTKAGTGNDEQVFWDIFGTGDMLALRQAVAERIQREPGWAPSRDLSRKMERQDAINKLTVESDSQHWSRVLEVADGEPSVLSCTSIDTDWRVAEAFAKTNMPGRALEVYRGILSTCVDKDERIATVRKSIAFLTTNEVKMLISLGEHRADGTSEFEAVKFDLIRQRFGNIAAGLAPDDLTTEEIKSFGDNAGKTRSVTDASLISWYYFAKQKWVDADAWFKLGLSLEDSPKLAEGHALCLRNSGDLAGAKKFAFEWRDRAQELRAIYVGIVVEELTRTEPMADISAENLKQFLDIVNSDNDANGSQAVAWYRYNRKEWPEAATWFMTTIDWSAASKKLYPLSEKTLSGYVLALQNMGKLEEAESAGYSWIDKGAEIRAIYVNIMNEELNKTEPVMIITPERLERFGVVVAADHSANGAQALAWYYYRTQIWANAVDWFKQAVAWSPDGGDAKINEGYALALKGAGRWAEAEDVAYAWRDRSPQMRAVYFGIVIDQMNKAEFAAKITEPRAQRFENVVLQDKSDDGAQALGWFRYGQTGHGYGVNWFKQAILWSPARSKDPKTNEGLAASLRLVGRLTEAEAVAYPFINTTELMKKLYVEIVVEELTHDNPPEPVPEPRIANFVAVIAPDMNPLGAQALGWYRLERHENADAVKWFRDALDWWPPQENLKHADQKTFEDYKAILAKLVMLHEAYRKSPRAYTSTATLLGRDQQSYVDTIEGYAKTMEGYALSLREAGDFAGAEAIAYSWRDRSTAMRDLFLDIAVSELTRDNSTAPIEPERMTRFVAIIEADHSIAGAQAMAWHASARKQWQAAANWFKVGLDWASNTTFEQKIDPKVAEGYVAALRNLNQLDDAEKIASVWRERSPALRKVYIDVAIEQIRLLKPGQAYPADRLARLTAAIGTEKTVTSAQAMGWYLYAQKDYTNALNWFKSANAWTPDGKGDAKSMEGYASTLKALGRSAEAVSVAYDWQDKSPELQALYLSAMVELLTKDTKGDQVSEDQLAHFSQTVNATRSSIGAQALGWYRYGQKGHGYAVDWFKSSIEWANDGKSDAKTNEGYALALRAVGRMAEAEAVVYPWTAQNEAMRTLYINIVVEEMTKDLPPEPISEPRLAQFVNVITPIKSALGAQALGWYRHERNEDSDGVVWFKNALDWWPTVIGVLGKTQQAAFVEDYQPILGKLALTHENYLRTPRAYSNPATNVGKNLAEYVKTPEGIAKTWEGYALTLRATGHLAEAEQIAFDWRDKWPSLRKLYLDMAMAALTSTDSAVMDMDRFARFKQVIEADHSGAGAQAIAWYHNAHKEWGDASNWFKTALGWRGTTIDPKADAKLYEGYIIALRGDGHADEAFNLASQWRDKSPELKRLFLLAATDILQNPKSTAPVSAALLEQLIKSAGNDKSLETSQALGWYFYGQKDYAAAQVWFKNNLTWSTDGKIDGKAIEGNVLTLRAMGKANEALDYAYEMRDKASNMRELYIELVADLLSKDGASAKISGDVIGKATAIVLADHNSKGAMSLGWYRLGKKDYAAAAEAFKNSIVWSTDGKGDVKAGEGYARALRGSGRFEEAENVAYSWYEDNEAMRTLYIEIVADKLGRTTSASSVNEESLRRFAAAVTRDSSAAGAQALAWYSYNLGQARPAAAWFEKSLAWEPSEASAVGLALSYKKLNDKAAYQRVIEIYRDRYSKVADLLRVNFTVGGGQQSAYSQPEPVYRPQPAYEPPAAAPRAAAPRPQAALAPAVNTEPTASTSGSSSSISGALAKKDYGTCLRTADALAASGRLTAADSVSRGWCLLNMGRIQEATLAFDRGLQGGLTGKQRDDAAYGKSMTLLRNGATAEAGAAAMQGNLAPARRNELGVEALAQQARSAYRDEQFSQALALLNRRAAYAPETRDLMMLRGWTLMKLGQNEAANQIFRTVDAQMSTSETQNALGLVNNKLLGR